MTVRLASGIGLAAISLTWACDEGREAAGGARLLAPGVISTSDAADELQPALTPDGRELYFVRRVPDGRFTIHVSSLGPGGAWGTPRIASFSGIYADQEPSVSADGNRLYFTSDRPAPGTQEPNRGREPWIVERSAGGDWGAPRPLEPSLTLDPPEGAELSRFWGQPRGPVEGPDGDLFFWAERPGSLGNTDLYRSPRRSGRLGEPVNVGAPINSARYETSAAFAPDGSWIIFGRDEEEGGYGLGDLYVSHRSEGGWSEPRNLGPLVNSPGFDSSPAVTPDGKTLLFSSNRATSGSEPGRHSIYAIDLEELDLAGGSPVRLRASAATLHLQAVSGPPGRLSLTRWRADT